MYEHTFSSVYDVLSVYDWTSFVQTDVSVARPRAPFAAELAP